MSSIYDYLNQRLVEANVRKDAAPAREVEAFLRDLLPAWEAATHQATPARPTLVAAAA
jgi:flagellar protein FliS